MTVRKPTPRDFPVLFARRQVQRDSRRRSWPACRCCGLLVEPRNRDRHFKACQRRKRLAPDLWAEWRKDMNA